MAAMAHSFLENRSFCIFLSKFQKTVLFFPGNQIFDYFLKENRF